MDSEPCCGRLTETVKCLQGFKEKSMQTVVWVLSACEINGVGEWMVMVVERMENKHGMEFLVWQVDFGLVMCDVGVLREVDGEGWMDSHGWR